MHDPHAERKMAEQSVSHTGFTQKHQSDVETDCSPYIKQAARQSDCSTQTAQSVHKTDHFTHTERSVRKIDRFTQTEQSGIQVDSSTQTEQYENRIDCSTHTKHYASQTNFTESKQVANQRGQRISHIHQSSLFGRPDNVTKKLEGQTGSPSKQHRVSQNARGNNASQTQCPKPKLLKEDVESATKFWRESVRAWYPNLHKQTYFLPPLYFNRVPYDVRILAGQTVLVSETPGHVPVNPVPSIPPSLPEPPPLASRVWPNESVPSGDPIPRVQDSDVTDDRATLRVLHNIRELAGQTEEPMMVLSQLDFRKYLDKQDAINAAATHLLRRPSTSGLSYGSFSLLIISHRYGLVVGDIKSVGADPQYSTDQVVVKRVEKAMKQLNKADVVLRQMVSDLAPVNVRKILMLPNITSTQLQQALSTHSRLEHGLCKCVGAPDTTVAVARCLCADTIQNKSSVWWQRAVTDHGHDKNMTDDIYETLVARFCGPATTVEVPTVTTPRRVLELRTVTEAIAHTGLRMAVLTLYPEQVELLNRPGLPRVFLWGPPGTGKTVVLVIKGLQWARRRKVIHLLSSHKGSQAITILIERQLLCTEKRNFATEPVPPPRVHRHMFNFNNMDDVKSAVNTLADAAANHELYVIADEVFCDGCGRFADFATQLAARVPSVHLWAAAVRRDVVAPSMIEQRFTTPLRCPPAVVKEIQQSEYFNTGDVPAYTSSPSPTPTDGPELKTLRHYTQSGALLPLHSCRQPRNCGCCANKICDLLVELRVGQSDQDLQYRDTIILCERPHDDLPVVSRLLANGLPVKVVTSRDDEATIHDLALAVHDAVIVADRDVVAGLERRVVVVIGNMTEDSDERLYALSRSTSLLVRVI